MVIPFLGFMHADQTSLKLVTVTALGTMHSMQSAVHAKHGVSMHSPQGLGCTVLNIVGGDCVFGDA